MWDQVGKAILAVLAFICFPFAVIAATAGVLALYDRVAHHHR
jgi:hypothetical protein